MFTITFLDGKDQRRMTFTSKAAFDIWVECLRSAGVFITEVRLG